MSTPIDSTAATRRAESRRVLTYGGALLAIAVVLLLLLRGCDQPPITVIAVGDMACAPNDPLYNDGKGEHDACKAKVVSDAALRVRAHSLWGLGDYQYEVPSAAAYTTAYEPTWGRLRAITRPALGNQEFKVHQANTFYDFFGERAGPRTGYYSYDLGDWHVVVLNTNCSEVTGGCGPESPQVAWLRQDLADTDARCVAAYGHHPRWSNGIAGQDGRVATLFSTLVDGRAALYLSGHEADYERFPPLNGTGQPDPEGTVQFVVGTGGQSLYPPEAGDASWRRVTRNVPSEFFQADHHGFVKFVLGAEGYSWAFMTDTDTVLDSGTATCPTR